MTVQFTINISDARRVRRKIGELQRAQSAVLSRMLAPQCGARTRRGGSDSYG